MNALSAPIIALGLVSAGLSVEAIPPRLEITNRAASATQLERFTFIAEEAVGRFTRTFAPMGYRSTRALRIEIGSGDSIMNGYDFEKPGKLSFHGGKEFPEHGLASADVIRHEIFHALFCDWQPGLCTAEAARSQDLLAIHESLADLFAHGMEPDSRFGEGFRTDRPLGRPYRNTLCYSLAEGPHSRGVALTSYFLGSGVRLEAAVAAIVAVDAKRVSKHPLGTLLAGSGVASADSCFSPEAAPRVAIEPLEEKVSPINRYRIDTESPLTLVARPDAAFARRHGGLRIRVHPKVDGEPGPFEVTHDEGSLTFEVRATEARGHKPWTVEMMDSQGNLVGMRTMYFGVAKRKP